MKSSLPIFALALAIVCSLAVFAPRSSSAIRAQTDVPERERSERSLTTAEPDQGDSSPERAAVLVRSAVVAIEQHDSITASVRVQLDAFGRRIRGAGRYCQAPWPDHQLALEIELPLEETTAKLSQVCDGRHLWIHDRLPGEETLHCVDVQQVSAALDRGAAPKPGAPSVRLLGLGGLPRLLRGLDHSFHFTSARRRDLNAASVWLLQGELRQERLIELLPGQKANIEAGGPADLTQLPPQLPDQVLLVLGQEDLFPYRVEWRRSAATVRKEWYHWGQDQGRIMLTIDFKDVQLGAPIDPERFAFDPSGLVPIDATAEYLQWLSP